MIINMIITISTEMNNYNGILPPLPPPNDILSINPSEQDTSPENYDDHHELEHKPEEHHELFIYGMFLYVTRDDNRKMLQNAWLAITQLKLWDYMKRDNTSYTMSDDYEIWIITKKMEELGYKGHSGFSFGWTMRNMQYIAQHGEENFMKIYTKLVSQRGFWILNICRD